MSSSVSFLAVAHCLRTLSLVAFDLVVLVALAARPRAALVAENLFLRKQLAQPSDFRDPTLGRDWRKVSLRCRVSN